MCGGVWRGVEVLGEGEVGGGVERVAVADVLVGVLVGVLGTAVDTGWQRLGGWTPHGGGDALHSWTLTAAGLVATTEVLVMTAVATAPGLVSKGMVAMGTQGGGGAAGERGCHGSGCGSDGNRL